MKKLFAFILILHTQIVLSQKKEFQITGTIDNIPKESKIYLLQNTDFGYADTLTIGNVKANQFELSGSRSYNPQLVFLKIVPPDNPDIDAALPLTLLIDTATIKITGDFKLWPEVSISGSKSTDDYNHFIAHNKIKYKEYLNAIKQNTNDTAHTRKALDLYRNFLISYFQSHPASLSTPLLLLNAKIIDSKTKENIYKKFPSDVASSFYGLELKKRIAQSKINEEMAIGQLLPHFTLDDESGKKKDIESIILGYSYTLIDFWAYWCVPCRDEIPNLKELYAQYSNRGFNIVSISIDPNKKEWLKALEREKMPWPNFIQNENISKHLFGVDAIPSYLLVDKNRKIISLDISVIGKQKNEKIIINGKKKSLSGSDLKEVLSHLYEQ